MISNKLEEEESCLDELIQNKILDLTTDNIQTTSLFFNSLDISGIDDFKQNLFFSILNTVSVRPLNVQLLCNFTCNFFSPSFINENEKMALLKAVVHIFPSNALYLGESYRLFFLHLFIENGFFDAEQVVSEFSSLYYNFTGIDFYLSMIFIWFAPEIEQYNKTFYNDIENKFKLLWEFEYNSLVIYNVCNNFSHYKENNWKLLKLHRNLNFHQSPASEYIANDDVNSLQILLSNTKLDINSRIQLSSYEWRAYLQKGPTLIQVSAFYGSLNCFKYLLLNGADLSMYDYEGKNVAHFAVAGGNNEIIRILLQKEIPFEGTLQVATKFHRNDIFRWIYDNNYVTLTEIHEVTGYVLQQATMSNNFYIMRFCIDNKINVNMSNIDGVLFYLSNWTPLHFAAQYNNVKTAQLLITQENIDLNCKTNLDFSPLHLTAINGSLEMCKLLLDQDNTDVNAIDNNNLTALHYAATYGHNNIIELFLSNDKVDVNAKDTYGNTPLHLAARYGHKEAVILLLQNEKTDPNATNEIFMNFL